MRELKWTPPKEVWMELHDEGRKRMATLMLIHGVSQLKVAEAVLEASGGRYGLQTMCEGAGMANATIIERL